MNKEARAAIAKAQEIENAAALKKELRGALAALKAMWAFASTMAERHGMNGDNTMTDADHKAWQDAAGASNAATSTGEKLIAKIEGF